MPLSCTLHGGSTVALAGWCDSWLPRDHYSFNVRDGRTIMKIAIVGRGNVGSGLSKLWTAARHEVTAFGHEGGDAAGADVVVVAVPYKSVAEALGKVSGLSGQVTIDACNVSGPRVGGFTSVAAEVKSIVGGPTAKAFTSTFAATFDQVSSQRIRPTALFAADDDARGTVEALIGDAGFEPLFIGALDPAARLLEDALDLWMAIASAGGLYFSRYAAPGEL